MSSSVNYTTMLRAAVVVASTGLYLKQGPKATAVALTLLGGTAFVAKVMHLAYGDILKWRQYRIEPYQGFDPVKHQAALGSALEQIQWEYPKHYQLYLDREKLTDKAQITEHFTKILQKGGCSGTASVIFDRIHRQKSASLRDGSSQLKEEEVFYFQLLRHIGIPKKEEYPQEVEKAIRIYKREKELMAQNRNNLLVPIGQVHSDVLQKMIEEFQEKATARKELLKNIHFEHFLKSDPFLSTSNLQDYQLALKKVTDQFPDEQDFVGILDLPKHVLSFQYGPKGYFIYDSFSRSKGLFAYPDKETFIKELRAHAIYDVTHIKQFLIKEKEPQMNAQQREEGAEALLKITQISLGMRPLNKIRSSDS